MASVYPLSAPESFEDGSQLHKMSLVLNKNDLDLNGRSLVQEIKDLVKQWNKEVSVAHKVP